MKAVFSFFEMFYSFRVSQGDVDRIGWSLSERSKFKVLTSPNGSHFSWKSIGRVEALSRVAFFVWTMALGKH